MGREGRKQTGAGPVLQQRQRTASKEGAFRRLAIEKEPIFLPKYKREGNP